MRFTLRSTRGGWYVFVPDRARSPINRVTLSYDEWLALGQPEALFVELSAQSPG